MPRSIATAIASLLLVVGVTRPALAQFPSISAYSTCSPDSSFVVWHVYDPARANPEWVGFDVLRRVLPGCDEYVRANDEIIPRLPDFGYVAHFQEAAIGRTIEYRVVPVDANRQPLFLGGQFCGPCVAYATCPPHAVPSTVGTLEELAPGFVYVIPCPGSCYRSPYLEGGVPPELAPYVGTGATFSFFGQVICGGVEGCWLLADHWNPGSCVTPAGTASWGRLKTIYR